jgi:hypothetical protein
MITATISAGLFKPIHWMSELRIVVGSGPNAVAAAHALLQRGFEVTMLDVGRMVEPDIAEVVARMARQEPAQWRAQDKAIVQRLGFGEDAAVNPKRTFGSAFAYSLDGGIDTPSGMRLYGSEAFGGLSNVWGCALLRARASELSGWPAEVTHDVLPAYADIEELVRATLGPELFAPTPNGTHLKISPGARTVMRRHRRSAAAMEASNLYNPIDLYPTPLAISPACKACNACMYGCVYGYTYNSRQTIEGVFAHNPRFRYIGGTSVQEFRETESGIEIQALNQRTNRIEIFHAKQLFLAAGLMGTLRILWSSNPEIARTLEVPDAATCIIPGFLPSPSAGFDPYHHGQSHLSVDFQLPPFEQKPAHFQLYFNNPAVLDGLQSRLPFLKIAPLRALVAFANRYLVFGQGYLHSDFCHTLALEYGRDGRITVSVKQNPDAARYIEVALTNFVRDMRRLGLVFLQRFAEVTPFGGSKTAGALPHANLATPTTSDPLGRPFGAKNVFVVDATVLGAVPGRNLTLTTMANAYRIGQRA